MESPASFKNAVEITPTAFSRPAGRSALAIEAEALFSRITGGQSSSDILRVARAPRRARDRGGGVFRQDRRGPAQLRYLAGGPGGAGGRAVERQYLGAAV